MGLKTGTDNLVMIGQNSGVGVVAQTTE
jgi:hypothetical protein